MFCFDTTNVNDVFSMMSHVIVSVVCVSVWLAYLLHIWYEKDCKTWQTISVLIWIFLGSMCVVQHMHEILLLSKIYVGYVSLPHMV